MSAASTRIVMKKNRSSRTMGPIMAQIVAADLGQVSEGDSDDKSGLNPFAERNDECLEHIKLQVLHL